jgi:hypothetical protein
MASKYKSKVDYKHDLLKAAKSRVLDYKHVTRTGEGTVASALQYLADAPDTLADPIYVPGVPFFSSAHSEYLKDAKYYLHSHNLRSNSLVAHIGRSTKEAFAKLRCVQRELLGLSAEVGEEEIKLLYNYSKVHLNTFTRGIDRPRQWGDQSMLQDFKTGFSYREKYLLSVQPNAGLTLPVRHMEETPIRDIYVVDETTDVGDSLLTLESTDPMNLTRNNKIFKHVIMRREYDNTSRKYKSRTTFDEYPYNCVSTVTLELEMPNLVMINYLKFEPICNSTLTIAKDGLTYRSEDGSEVSLNSVSVPGELSTTLFFQPVHTKYIKIKFEQYGTVGRKDLVVGDKKITAINSLLKDANFYARMPDEGQKVTGRVYDFSIADMSVGLVVFEPKGIFRSGTPINVDSPIGFDIKWAAEQLLPVETFDTYLRSVILPEGKTLYEFYCYLRLFGGGESTKVAPIATENTRRKIVDQTRDTLIVDSLVPMPDSYPIQMEYLKCIGNEARVKLYPDLRWSSELNCIEEACTVCLKESFSPVSLIQAVGSQFIEMSTNLQNLTITSQASTAFDANDDPNVYNLTTYSYPTEWIHGGAEIPSSSEVNIRTALEDAVINAAGLSNTTALGTEYNIIYTSPSDEDLEFILGWKFTEASPNLKEQIRQNPQDYLLIDPGIFRSQGKSWRLFGSSTFYSVTNRVEADTTFESALNGTKLMAVTVNEVSTVGVVTTILVSLAAVRAPLTEQDTKEQSPEDSVVLMEMSRTNFYAHKLNNTVLSLSNEVAPTINEDLLQKYPDVRTAYNDYVAATDGNQVVWEKRILGLTGNGPVHAGAEPVTAYFKTRGSTGPHGYFAARAWDENDYSSADVATINSNLFVSFLPNPENPEELIAPTLPNVPPQIPVETLVDHLPGFTEHSAAFTRHLATGMQGSGVSLNVPPVITLIGCKSYLIIGMSEPHGYDVGDVVAFKAVPYTIFPGEYKVALILNSHAFGILTSDIPTLNTTDLTIFECQETTPQVKTMMATLNTGTSSEVCCLKNAQQYCVINLTKMDDPIEVYQDSELLIIGEDYLISLDDKSSWLGSWALEASFDEYHRKAKAGRFHIKFLNQDPGSIYWIKYRVKKNQILSNEGLVYLKNGRVTCDQSLRGASGTADVVAIARTNSTNPYITPILREYSLRIQEEPHVKRDSGKLKRKKVTSSNRSSTM